MKAPFNTEHQLMPLFNEGKEDEQWTEWGLQGMKLVGASSFRNREFISELDFQAFYLKQTQKTTTLSAVFMNMSLLWISQDTGNSVYFPLVTKL